MTTSTRICPFFIRTNSSWQDYTINDTVLELLAKYYTGLSFKDLTETIGENGVVPDRISDEVRKFCEAASTAYYTDKSIELVVWLMSDGSWQIEPFHATTRGRKTFMNKNEHEVFTGVKSSKNIIAIFKRDSDNLTNSFPYLPSSKIYIHSNEYLEISPPPIA